ncbi:MAG TPA: HAD hydrolase family protein, partial [Stellaceae bacterium]|nr:HAD hydrolase family protein [Stellaceae bacterium]
MTDRIALVVSDVDGTLVTPDKILTERARAAVASLARHGIAFTIISSRPPFGLKKLVEALNLRLPIAAFNGGVLALPDLTPLARHPIGADAVGKAVSCFEDCGVLPWLFTEDNWHIRDRKGAYVDHEIRTVDRPPVIVESFAPLYDRAIKIVGASA